MVWNNRYVTEMAPGQNATRVKLVSRTLQNPAPCYARVKYPPFLPIIAPRLRSLAIRPKQFYGPYGDSLHGLALRPLYHLIASINHSSPLLISISPYFSLTPNSRPTLALMALGAVRQVWFSVSEADWSSITRQLMPTDTLRAHCYAQQ